MSREHPFPETTRVTDCQKRRAEERRTRKLARKAARTAVEQPIIPDAPLSDIQLRANRINARHSTGPRTAAGREASAHNNFRHGFARTFTVLPTEDPAAFEQLLDDLHTEHDPQIATEDLLVNDMARHYWLTQRAFHRCLADLLKLRKSEASRQNGFESQKREGLPQPLCEINRHYYETGSIREVDQKRSTQSATLDSGPMA